jgi:hypothetical protein
MGFRFKIKSERVEADVSVVEDTEQDRGTVLQYAPRHLRFPAEQQSIRPILERLRRGEIDAQDEAQPEPPRVVQTIPLELPRNRIGWQLVTCAVLSAGVSAGLAVLAIAWLAPAKTEFTRIDAIQLDPKSVHTVSFKQNAPAARPSESDLQKSVPESAPPIQPKDAPPPSKAEAHNDQIAPKELLALWAGIPADLPSAMTGDADAPAPVSAGGPTAAETEAPPAPSSEHRTAAPNRRAHVRHRNRVRRTATARTTGQAASAAAQTANPNSLQSSLQSLFGGGAQQTQAPSGAAAASPSASDY